MIGDDFNVITNTEFTNQENNPTDTSKIHIMIKQRGRKSLTFIFGLPESLDLKQIGTEMKKKFSCTGSVKQEKNPEKGIEETVVQLTGDQRSNAKEYLIKKGLAEASNIQIHGY